MFETASTKKNKIQLSDYDYQIDITNRIIMSTFTPLDVEILEELLYSSIKIPVKKLSKSLHLDESKVLASLDKLSQTNLLHVKNDTVFIDKKLRKYFEFQILKFEDKFSPNMEFLQKLLKHTPIHVLPQWYSIPRSSNHIFDSIVEKFLITPKTFQRYINELSQNDTTITSILEEIHRPPFFKVTAQSLQDKLSLSRNSFEEYMLYLEYSLICCQKYEKIEGKWVEVIEPYHEWKEYLSFIHRTETKSIENDYDVERFRNNNFSFIEDMSCILKHIKSCPQPIKWNDRIITEDTATSLVHSIPTFAPDDVTDILSVQTYLTRIIERLLLLRLSDQIDNKLYALESANNWLDMDTDKKALYLYQHPSYLIASTNNNYPTKHIRASEKSITRAMGKKWVYFDEFLQGVKVIIRDDHNIYLKKAGKKWGYKTPQYIQSEEELIQSVIYDYLFEIGAVAIGYHNGRKCFTVTPFGRRLFEE
jgi:predicted transcriptional regulator